MKKIGIIGGLGPESTKMYYDKIIDLYKVKAQQQLPEIIIYSVNMEEMKKYLEMNDLDTLAAALSEKAEALVRAGADFVAIASNSPHIVFDRISEKSKVPMISIVDEAAKFCTTLTRNQRVGLVGTGFTMKADFFPANFSRYGLSIFVPENDDQEYIHEKIFSELALGIVRDETRKRFFKIVESMVEKYSIDTLVLGCTELPLIFDREFSGLKYIDTVTVHVQAIIDFCFYNML